MAQHYYGNCEASRGILIRTGWIHAFFLAVCRVYFLAGYLMYLSLMVKHFSKTNTKSLLIFLSVVSFALMVPCQIIRSFSRIFLVYGLDRNSSGYHYSGVSDHNYKMCGRKVVEAKRELE